jgi:hypothetical protein
MRYTSKATSPRTHRKPTLIVALDPVSADRLYDVLSAAVLPGNDRVRPCVMRMSRFPASRSYLGCLTSPRGRRAAALIRQSRFLIVDADLFFWLDLHNQNPKRFDIIYLHPSLIILEELYELYEKPHSLLTAFQRKLLIDFNRYLSGHPNINIETLFYEPRKVIELLNEKYGLEIDSQKFAKDDPSWRSAYTAAMTACLHLTDGWSGIRTTGLRGFATGRTYQTRGRGLGVLALNRGWTVRDNGCAWSSGVPASLVIPLCSDRPSVRLRLLIEAEVNRTPCEIRIVVAGMPAQSFFRLGPDRQFKIRIPVEPSRCDAGSVIETNIECRSLSEGDQARIAIKSFRLMPRPFLVRLWESASAALVTNAPAEAVVAEVAKNADRPSALPARLRRIVDPRIAASSLVIGLQDTASDVDLKSVLLAAGLENTVIGLDEPDAPTASAGLPALFASAVQGTMPLDLIALSSAKRLPEVFEWLAKSTRCAQTNFPDILVFATDPGAICDARYVDEERYANLLHPEILDRDLHREPDKIVVIPWHVCIETDFVYISLNK